MAPTAVPTSEPTTMAPTPNVTQVSLVCQIVDQGDNFDKTSWVIAVLLFVFVAFFWLVDLISSRD